MDIKIRKATKEDLPVVYKLVKEFAAFLGKTDQLLNRVEDFEEGLEYSQCLLAENNKGEIVGYAFFMFIFHTWTGKTIYLEDLFVKENCRGFSIGTLLTCALIDFAKQNHIKNIEWQVYESNQPAINFYKKMGAIVGDNSLNCRFSI